LGCTKQEAKPVPSPDILAVNPSTMSSIDPSWELEAVGPPPSNASPGEGQNPSPPHCSDSSLAPHPPKVIVLDDILKANPLESEAETLIFSVLERQEVRNRARTNTATSTLLHDIPDFAVHMFNDDLSVNEEPDIMHGESRSIASHNSRFSKMSQKTRKKGQTLEETLFGLTKALGTANPTNPGSPVGAAGGKEGAVGALAHDATLIFRGKAKKGDIEAGTVEAEKRPAVHHWGLLKKTIQFAHHSGETKKNDDNRDDDMSILDETEGAVNDGIVAPVASAEDGDAGPQSPKKKSSTRWGKASALRQLKESTAIVTDFHSFAKQRRRALQMYCKMILLIVFPATGIAAILFYLGGNPPTGRVDLDVSTNLTALVNIDGALIDSERASASWWIIFICVRHLVLFSFARLLQVIIIDFICLSSRLAVNGLGQLVTLFIASSKGWPFIVTFWGVLSFLVLSGEAEYVRHWGYWQDTIGLFNNRNPGGSVTSAEWYHRVLAIAVSVGLVVSAKRVWLGFFLGQKTYLNYAEDLAMVMKKIFLLSKVATLSRALAREAEISHELKRDNQSMRNLGMSREKFHGLIRSTVDGPSAGAAEQEKNEKSANLAKSFSESGFVVDPNVGDSAGGLNWEHKRRIDELLGQWEEPEKEYGADDIVSISAILQFRASLAALENPFMFTIPWGEVSTRDNMVISSQKVFRRINSRTPESSTVRFNVLARAALDDDGDLDQEILEDLIRLLRPDRDGNLSLLDFVKVRPLPVT
jgi:hypothetical protein